MEYGFLRKEDEFFPPILHVETTNICNLRCIHCPHNDIYAAIPDYKPQSIKFDLWKKIVDEVCQFDSTLRLTPDGEPLILKDFVEQVKYVQEKKVKTFAFNTHGMFLENEIAEVLLAKSETNIAVEVSLDALYKNSYDKIRLQSDYNRVLKNIFNFVYERNKRKIENVKIMVSIVAQPEVSESEIKLFNEFWSQVVDKVIIRNYVDTKGLTPTKGIDEREVENRWPCLVVFTRLVITYDGGIRFCPDDWQKSTTVANLNNVESIQSVWTSPQLVELRKNHLERKFSHPTCKKCTDWKVIRWGSDYTKALSDVFSENKSEREDNLKFLWKNDLQNGGKK